MAASLIVVESMSWLGRYSVVDCYHARGGGVSEVKTATWKGEGRPVQAALNQWGSFEPISWAANRNPAFVLLSCFIVPRPRSRRSLPCNFSYKAKKRMARLALCHLRPSALIFLFWPMAPMVPATVASTTPTKGLLQPILSPPKDPQEWTAVGVAQAKRFSSSLATPEGFKLLPKFLYDVESGRNGGPKARDGGWRVRQADGSGCVL